MKIECPNCKSTYKISQEEQKRKDSEFRCRLCGFEIHLEDTLQDLKPLPSSPPTARERISLIELFNRSFSEAKEQAGSRLFVSVKAHESENGDGSLPTNVLIPIDNTPWYAMVGEDKNGPMDARSLELAYRKGMLQDDTIIWKEGMSSWVTLESCMVLIGLIAVLEGRELEGSSSRGLASAFVNVIKTGIIWAGETMSFLKAPLQKKSILPDRRRRRSVDVRENVHEMGLDDGLDKGIRDFREEMDAQIAPGDEPQVFLENIKSLDVEERVESSPEKKPDLEPEAPEEETLREGIEVPVEDPSPLESEEVEVAAPAEVEEPEVAEEKRQRSEDQESVDAMKAVEIVKDIIVEDLPRAENDGLENENLLDDTEKKDPAPDPLEHSESENEKKPPEESRMVSTFNKMKEIYSIHDQDAAARFSISIAREVVECEATRCLFFTPGKSDLYVAASEGNIASGDTDKKFSSREGMIGHMIGNEGPLIIADASNDERFDPEIDGLANFAARQVLSVAVTSKGRRLGFVTLFNRLGESEFTPYDGEILAYIASTLGDFIEESLPEQDGFRESDFDFETEKHEMKNEDKKQTEEK